MIFVSSNVVIVMMFWVSSVSFSNLSEGKYLYGECSWEKSCLGSDTNIEWKLGEGECSTYNTFTLLQIHFVVYLFIYFFPFSFFSGCRYTTWNGH